jgi:hypothetical protein
MDGWPSRCLFNYDYQIVNLSEAEFELLQACDANSAAARTVGEILTDVELGLEEVRLLLKQQLILLTPG